MAIAVSIDAEIEIIVILLQPNRTTGIINAIKDSEPVSRDDMIPAQQEHTQRPNVKKPMRAYARIADPSIPSIASVSCSRVMLNYLRPNSRDFP